MNGIHWKILTVDQSSPILIDRTGNVTLACTDPVTKRVFLSNTIPKELYLKVLLHELGHCAMVSYNLIDDIHRMVKPRYWIEAEEFICNFIADYGLKIFTTAENVVKVDVVGLV